MAASKFSLVATNPKKKKGRLKKKDIRWLTFSGGGAKGIAHIGALFELERQNIIQHMGVIDSVDKRELIRPRTGVQGMAQGYAGASIGAIIATLASSGYTANQIKISLLDSHKLPLAVGLPSGLKSGSPGLFGASYGNYATNRKNATRVKLGKNIMSALLKQGRGLIVHDFKKTLDKIKDGLNRAGLISKSQKKQLEDIVGPFKTANFFLENLGIFNGLALRTLINEQILLKLTQNELLAVQQENEILYKNQNDKAIKENMINSISFDQHERIFKAKLAMTGSNLETGKAHIFSAQTTPTMPVADAVRITASFPLLFRPVFITEQVSKSVVGNNRNWKIKANELKGVWIDGGAFDNLPWKFFPNDIKSTGAEALTLSFTLGAPPTYNLSGPNGKNDKQAKERYSTLLGSYAIPSLGAAEQMIASTYGDVERTVVQLDPNPFDTLEITKYSELSLSPKGQKKIETLFDKNGKILKNHLKQHFI